VFDREIAKVFSLDKKEKRKENAAEEPVPIFRFLQNFQIENI
jgi:hypothetical protein